MFKNDTILQEVDKMFTYVKAKNFKSLKDIEFNLNKTKAKTNQFISIYGENGSGKTNIITTINNVKSNRYCDE